MRNTRRMNCEASAPMNTAAGDQELCAWQPVRGVVWVQTRCPQLGRQLGRRRDGRMVVCGVAGGYLRAFEFRRSLAWAGRLMKRYRSDEMVTNAARKRAVWPEASRTPRSGRSALVRG